MERAWGGGKTAVMGLLERHSVEKGHSRIKVAEVLPSRPTKKALIGRVKKYVIMETGRFTPMPSTPTTT